MRQLFEQGEWTDRNGASDYLLKTWGIRRAPSTLGKLASIGGGPEFRRANRQAVYHLDSLDAWARELIGIDGNSEGRAA